MNTQDTILTYIYQQIPLGKYRYKMLKTKEDLDFLKKNPHYIAPNYYGHNNLLVLTKIGTDFYSFFIDRKTLTYSKDKLDSSRVVMKKIKIFATADLYNGTILDGILVNNNKKQSFIVTDAYQISGKSFLNIEYKLKMQQLKNILSKKIKKLDAADDIEYYVDDFKTYIDLETMTDVKKNKINTFNEFNSRGIIFYPSISGHKFIFTLNNVSKDNSQHDGNSMHEIKNKLTYNSTIKKSMDKSNAHVKFAKKTIRPQGDNSVESDSESSDSSSDSDSDSSSDSDSDSSNDSDSSSDDSSDDSSSDSSGDSDKKVDYKSPSAETGIFLMKKTITSDVYELYLDNNKKKVKIGIALITGISCSKKCRDYFPNDIEEVIIKCNWHKKFTKWVPDDLSKKKLDSIKSIYN